MVLRLILVCALVLCAARLVAQSDTTVLKQVIIRGAADKQFLAGSTIHELDSTLKEINSSRHLGEVLSFQFPIYFRNYGSGMLSSISVRGTSAQQTAVLWNGININSFSLGQADFSMLPSNAFDSVSVHAGGGSARFGSGAFGGTVLLSSSISKKQVFSFTQEFASFGRYFTSLGVDLHKDDLIYNASVYHLQAENNFPIIGTDEKQQHAATLLQGTTQNLRYQLTKRESISLHYWYHYADRELQPPVGTVNNRDEQQDENHRLLLSYEVKKPLSTLQQKTGFIDDHIIYNRAKSNVRRWFFLASQSFVVNKTWNTEWSVNANQIVGNIKEYASGQAKENRTELALSTRRDFGKVAIAANLRQPFISYVSAPLLIYVGTDLILFEKSQKSIQAKANVSRNFRAPTLNERYWQNAGDKNIKPEQSYGAEAGFVFRAHAWQVATTGFYQLVDEWILWKPNGEGGNYIPQNITQVEVLGMEAAISVRQKINHGFINAKILYQPLRSLITKAPIGEERTLGKQLMLTPKHTVSAFAIILYAQWRIVLSAQGTGIRYGDSGNSSVYALGPYILSDFSLGRTFTIGRSNVSFNASVKNVSNTEYQLYSARSQPGQNFSLQLNYQFNPKL
jgi:vitamin B12 transporter